MNIFFRELRAHRKSLIIWSVGLALLILSSMAKYSGYEKAGQSANELINSLPDAVVAAMGLGGIDLTQAIWFYSVIFIYILVMGAIHASLLGADIISKEEQDKTAEFLLAKPITRVKIITAKLFAALFNILVLNLVSLASSIVIVGAYNKGPSVTGDLVLLTVGLLLVQLIFLSIGMAIAAFSRRPKLAAPVATAILLFTFFLSLWLDISGKLQNLKYVTPFKYFVARDIIQNAALDSIFVLLSIGITAIMLITTYVFYKRRDLSI